MKRCTRPTCKKPLLLRWIHPLKTIINITTWTLYAFRILNPNQLSLANTNRDFYNDTPFHNQIRINSLDHVHISSIEHSQ